MRPVRWSAWVGWAAVVSMGVAGCGSSSGHAVRSARPGTIVHPVFITLADPSDAPQLIRDCEAWLAPIPGIVSYACGAAYESGRDVDAGAFDVGLVIEFESPEAYAAYVDHPGHVRLLEQWRSRTLRVEIRDVVQAGP